MVVGDAVAQVVGQAQDPLAQGSVGHDAVDEVGGQAGHALATAGGAEAAALAGEGDEAVVTAAVAVHAGEAVGEDAAVEEGAQLAAHEARKTALGSGGGGEEGLQVLLQRAVERGGLGLAAAVAAGARGQHAALWWQKCAGSRRRFAACLGGRWRR